MWVCVVREFNANEPFRASLFDNKTAEQISAMLDLGGHRLTVRTPFFRKRVSPSCVVTREFPGLLLQTRPEKYPPPPFHLACVPAGDSDDVVYYFGVETQMKTVFPEMPVPVASGEMSGMSVGALVERCRGIFEYGCEKARMKVNGADVAENESARRLFDEMEKGNRVVFACVVDDAAQKKINHRIFFCDQLVTTEQTYINDLQEIITYWEPAIRASKLFDDAQLKALFRDVPTIRNSHAVFLDSLKSEPVSFAMQFGTRFLAFVQFFKLSATFVSQYKQMDTMIKDRMKQKSFQSKFSEIEAGLPAGTGRDFLSYYVVPVQRYPRYPLLVRDLMKETPDWHPDKEYLKLALTAVDKVNKEIDHSSFRMKRLAEIETVQKAFGNTITILEAGRELLHKTDVRITRPKSTHGVVFLFNDLVVVATVGNKNHYTPILSSSVEGFCFSNCRPTPESIFFINENRDYVIQFNDLEEKSSWMQPFVALREAELAGITKTDTKGHSFVKWTDLEVAEGVPSLMNHEGTRVGNMLYFFGGSNASLSDSNTLVMYDPAAQTWTVHPSDIPVRVGHGVASVGDKMYVCFGAAKKLGLLDDIWCYSSKKWAMVRPKGDTPVKRMGHTCVAGGKMIYIFGGEDENGNLLNDVCVLDVERNTFKQYKNLKHSPSARKFHSAVYLPKTNEMVVIGGRTQRAIVGDIHVLKLSKMKWREETRPMMSERMYHKSWLAANRFLLTFGGNSKNSNGELAVIDTATWDSVPFEQRGNVPVGLSSFAMADLDENRLVTFGGTDASTRTPFACSYMLDVKGSIFEREPTPSRSMTQAPKKKRKKKDHSRKQTIGLEVPPAPAPPPTGLPRRPSSEIIKNANFKAEPSFNPMKVFESLNIDISKLLPVEQAAAKMRVRRIWVMKDQNDKLEETVNKMAGMLHGKCELPPNTPLLLKVFDDATKTTKILKANSSNTAREIEIIVKSFLRRAAVFSLQTKINQKGDLTDANLDEARKSIFYGELRSLIVIAL